MTGCVVATVRAFWLLPASDEWFAVVLRASRFFGILFEISCGDRIGLRSGCSMPVASCQHFTNVVQPTDPKFSSTPTWKWPTVAMELTFSFYVLRSLAA